MVYVSYRIVNNIWKTQISTYDIVKNDTGERTQ